MTQVVEISHCETINLYSQYQGCWWPVETWSQGIGSHGIDLVLQGYFALSTWLIWTVWTLMSSAWKSLINLITLSPLSAKRATRFAVIHFVKWSLIYWNVFQIFICQKYQWNSEGNLSNDMSMALCRTEISPLLMHWRYCSLALSHQCIAHEYTACTILCIITLHLFRQHICDTLAYYFLALF